MATSTEANQINWEHGLHDVMDNIVKYLTLKELYTMTKVSKSWRKAALYEKSRRFYIQQLHLFYYTKLKVSTLKVKPHASLLIYDINCALKAKNLVEYLRERLPQKVIALKVNKYLTTQDVEKMDQCPSKVSNLTADMSFLGLFYPSMKRRATVQVIWEPSEVLPLSTGDRIDYFARELGLHDSGRAKSTILLFTHSRQGFEIANALVRNRIQEDRETAWTGMFQELPIAARCNREGYMQSRVVVALKISGPSVESWSASLDSGLPRDRLDLELRGLRGRMRRGRHCTGLFYSPAGNAYGDGREIMRNVRRIFPDVPFVGLFNSKLWSGADAFFDLPNDNYLQAMNYMSIIIISYD